MLGALPSALISCRSSNSGSAPSVQSANTGAPVVGPRPALAPIVGASPSAPAQGALCLVTEDNIEGPYYRPGAPKRSSLPDPGMKGVPLVITGRVLSRDCKTPLSEALLDLWQADAAGRYDNDGTFGRGATPLRLRGKVLTDASGAYAIRTIVPGRYLNGRRYRPAHIHVKLTAPGHAPLTTQLYFPDDPYNEGDPFIVSSLIMGTITKADGMQANFEFVLPVA